MSQHIIKIDGEETERFAQVCAELVKLGICFGASYRGGDWEIVCTGGF